MNNIKLIFFYSNLICIFHSIIILPFYRIYPENSNDEVEKNIYNNIFIDIEIGTPPQKIPFKFSTSSFGTYVASDLITGNFEKFTDSLSRTFNLLSEETISFHIQPVETGHIGSDIMLINNYKFNGMKFIIADKMHHPVSGVIGLKTQDKHDEKVLDCNFIKNLKQKDLINSYAFTIYYDNETSGKIIIGDLPHVFNKKYYSINDFNYGSAEIRAGNDIEWDVKFSEINYGDVYTDVNLVGELDVEFGLLLAPNPFKIHIENNFFRKYLISRICVKKSGSYYYDSFYYYACKKPDPKERYTEQFNISEFKNITFVKNEWKVNITFTKEELFFEDEENYYFKIVIQEKAYRWILGNLFSSKINITYDQDRKIIGTYVKSEEHQNIKKKKKNYIIYTFIYIALIIVIILSIILYKNVTQFVRKKRKYEIIDEYDTTINYSEVKNQKSIEI
jgi:hypothetical protein